MATDNSLLKKCICESVSVRVVPKVLHTNALEINVTTYINLFDENYEFFICLQISVMDNQNKKYLCVHQKLICEPFITCMWLLFTL